MQNILILCGGESGEHEVSLQSANSIARFIPRDRYKPILVGIDKEGNWMTGDPLMQNTNDPSRISLAGGLKPAVLADRCINGERIDVVFPIIHGTYGEDGSLQGLLQMEHLPYVGAGVLGSAVGMDKDIMKRLLLYAGLNCSPYEVIYAWQGQYPSYTDLKERLGSVLFVKPCNLGSSVGISCVKGASDFEKAVAHAFEFDNKVLVESGIDGREVEVSVLGNEKPIASVPGEIIPSSDFYSYDAKYIDSGATQLAIPADLPEATVRELQALACQSFRLLELFGLARADFFVEADGKIWINELNTLPGFTNISMYPKLWEASGIPYSELIHRLIRLASQRFEAEGQLKRTWI